ncbi:MAG TPA: redox-regulated ATPase YchF [Candidatus Acidoferrales bacterium]|nr:redox-regulated ATPase YchF [Candidatus Acidoferrales bacterium]
MNLSCGIVGLPNVGKSTLFNALLKKQAALAANYPFATIEPNVGVVPVPDSRLEKLAEITAKEIASSSSTPRNDELKLPPIKNALIEFVDIAGLVKGASEGAGLGNKFLSHIREVKIVAHVVRVFEDADVIKEGAVDPKSDYEVIRAELIIADLQTVEKQRESKAVKTDATKKSAVEKLYSGLNEGKSAFEIALTDEERASIKDLFLLSNKAELIVLNVSEEDYTAEKIPEIIERYKKLLGIAASPSAPRNDDNMVVICAKIEAELAALSDEEAKEYLADLGLESSGLERLIQKAYEELGLISFLTAGEKEVKAWTIDNGLDAQHAAGAIHTDFIKKFIKAEVVSFEDYVAAGGRKKAREVGKARLEGKDYIVKDGDVIEFKIGS